MVHVLDNKTVLDTYRSLNAIKKKFLQRNNIQSYIIKNIHMDRNTSGVFQRMTKDEPLLLVCVDNSKFFVLLDNENSIELIFDYNQKKISVYHVLLLETNSCPR